MNERFFIYSIENRKKIKLLVLLDEKISTINALVVKNEADFIEIIKSERQKNAVKLSKEQVLSCAYARGDHGDTLDR